MKSASAVAAAVMGLLVLTACSPIAVEDPHADTTTRMHGIADRFDHDRRTGGMAAVVADVQNCYRSATEPLVQIYALRDCMVLDHVGYETDVAVGRKLLGGPALPYFEDGVFATRVTHYAKLDGFTSPGQLANTCATRTT